MPGAIAIWKSEVGDVLGNITWIEDLVRRSERVESMLFFAGYLDRAGLTERALQTARRGAELAPKNFEVWFQIRISSILLKVGDTKGAVAAAERAVQLNPASTYCKELLERARRQTEPASSAT
jgi:hypothetical protein